MADDHARQGETFRAPEFAGKKIPANVVVTMTTTVLAGNQTLSVVTGSDTTLTVPSGATRALMTVDGGGGDIRYWEDGTSPSTSAGLLIPAGGAQLRRHRPPLTSRSPAIDAGSRASGDSAPSGKNGATRPCVQRPTWARTNAVP